MAFIEKLSEKIANGATSISNSAKKAGDSARINSEISTNKRNIEETYTKLGKLVKEKLQGSLGDPEAEQLCADIDSMNARIAELQNELAAVKAKRFCPKCKAELDPDALFCAECGTRIEQPAEESAQQKPVTLAKKVVAVKSVSVAHVAAPESADDAPVELTEPVTSVEKSQASEIISDSAEDTLPAAVETDTAEAESRLQETADNDATDAAEQIVPDMPEINAEPDIPAEPVISPAPDIEPINASNEIICPNCGNSEFPDSLFCSNCGTRLKN